MWVAWDRGKWIPLEEEDVEQVRAKGYEVREVPFRCEIAPEWLDPQFMPEIIATEVEHGMAAMERYLSL